MMARPYRLLRSGGKRALVTHDGWHVTDAPPPLAHRCPQFRGYGPGLRFAYVRDGGKDNKYWKGHYGEGVVEYVLVERI